MSVSTPNAYTRACSRKRPTIWCAMSPSVLWGMSALMQQMPRITSITRTPARHASDILSITSRSVSEFIFMNTWAGSPARARPISRFSPRMTSGFRPLGATPR